MNKEIIEKIFSTLKNINKNKDKDIAITGFTDLDIMLKNMEKGSLITIGSRPSIGKTAFALSIMKNQLKCGEKCLYYSFEQSKENFLKRFMLSCAEVDYARIKSNNLSDEEWRNLEKSKTKMLEWNFEIEDSILITPKEIKAQIEKTRPNYVFVDYLQLMKQTTNESREDSEIAQIITDLKNIAVETNTTIFVISQLFRAIENRKDKMPKLLDFKGSKCIAEISDVVIFIHREDYYADIENTDEKPTAEIKVAKNKYGAIGYFKLNFECYYSKFSNPIIHNTF